MPTPTKGPRLGGSPAHEKAIIANLARALFENGRITTTLTKAKRLRPRAEHLITFAKKGDLASRRQVLRVVRDKDVVFKLFDEIAPRYADRQGGYTRILKLGPRQGDNAPMALIELVDQAPVVAEPVTEEEAPTRRRFGRRREAQEAPAGANRAQRRAAARGKLPPTAEHDHDHEHDEDEVDEATDSAETVEETDEDDDTEDEATAADEGGASAEAAADEDEASADASDDDGEEAGDAKRS